MEENRTVDVLIPTYKPDQRCVQLVKRLLNQSVQVNRIYLIDTESGIFPKELYTISDRVKIHRILPEEFDHGGTRNLGAEMSDAEILVYMTQDAMPADQFLIERLLYGFSYENVAKYLMKSGRPWLLVSLVCKSGWKYMGYKLGKNYKKLPRWLILKCTMNPRYWRET